MVRVLRAAQGVCAFMRAVQGVFGGVENLENFFMVSC